MSLNNQEISLILAVVNGKMSIQKGMRCTYTFSRVLGGKEGFLPSLEEFLPSLYSVTT